MSFNILYRDSDNVVLGAGMTTFTPGAGESTTTINQDRIPELRDARGRPLKEYNSGTGNLDDIASPQYPVAKRRALRARKYTLMAAKTEATNAGDTQVANWIQNRIDQLP